MTILDPITKATKVFPRADGSEARVTATAMFGSGLHQSIDICVFVRKNADQNWRLCNKDPHPDWRVMSVNEYVQFGRPEHLQAVSFGELLGVSSLIGQSLSAVNAKTPGDLPALQ